MLYHLEGLFHFHWKWDVAELVGTNSYPDIDCFIVRGKVK